MDWIDKQMKRIPQIDDEFERRLQWSLLGEIIDIKNQLHDRELQYAKQLKYIDMTKRGAEITKINKTTELIKSRWINAFVSDLNKDMLNEISIHSFLWHVFSFEKKSAHTQTEARRRFNTMKKNRLIMFYQNEEEVFLIQNAKKLKSSDFDYEQDVYIVDEDFSWTYIYTHDIQCGPYFYENDNDYIYDKDK